MEASELINDIIFYLSDTENDYHVSLLVDGEQREFKVELNDGNIQLVATD